MSKCYYSFDFLLVLEQYLKTHAEAGSGLDSAHGRNRKETRVPDHYVSCGGHAKAGECVAVELTRIKIQSKCFLLRTRDFASTCSFTSEAEPMPSLPAEYGFAHSPPLVKGTQESSLPNCHCNPV